MFKIINNTIHITRGDVGLIEIKAKNDDGADYQFKANDVVRLNVFKAKDCKCIFLQKNKTLEQDAMSVDINLTSEDTKIEDIINKKKVYWYEIVLNPDTNPQTIVGYDEDGAKEFILYPEGDDEV